MYPFSPFVWLRRKAAESVAAGVADAIQAVTPEGEAAPDLAALRERVAQAVEPRALPAAGEEPGKRKRGGA